MKTLAFDTSNQALAVAIGEDQKIIANFLSTAKKTHSQTLMPAIDSLMKSAQLEPKELDRIVVSKGPGSYTGLRIGVTTAKTLAWTLGIELVGISSLAAIAGNVNTTDQWIIPLMNARRNNVYTGAYRWENGTLSQLLPDQHINVESWLQLLKEKQANAHFVGNDVDLFREQILTYFPEQSLEMDDRINQVNGATLLQLAQRQQPEANIEAFVPDYLKLVEAEEKWLATQKEDKQSGQNYVEKV